MMTAGQARKAIEGILAALPDKSLPKPDKVEQRDDVTIAWYGGHGYHLGSSKRGNQPVPGGTYRSRAAYEALEMEAVRRLDLKHHAEHPDGGAA